MTPPPSASAKPLDPPMGRIIMDDVVWIWIRQDQGLYRHELNSYSHPYSTLHIIFILFISTKRFTNQLT